MNPPTTSFMPPIRDGFEGAVEEPAVSLTSEPSPPGPSTTEIEVEVIEETPANPSEPRLLVVGAAALDITTQPDGSIPFVVDSRVTVPGKVSLSLGGVARNVAEAAHRILTDSTQAAEASPVLLIAPVGNDLFASAIKSGMHLVGMRTDGLYEHPHRTTVCAMHLDNEGELRSGVADMEFGADTDVSVACGSRNQLSDIQLFRRFE